MGHQLLVYVDDNLLDTNGNTIKRNIEGLTDSNKEAKLEVNAGN
jgi:hypothetical protein